MENNVPEYFDGTLEEWEKFEQESDEMSMAEQWFFEHRDDDSWENSYDGLKILVDDAPDYVYKYANVYNANQQDFDESVKIKNKLFGK